MMTRTLNDDSDIEEGDLADTSGKEVGMAAAAAKSSSFDDDDGSSDTGSAEDVDGWSQTFSTAGLPEQRNNLMPTMNRSINCHQMLSLPNSFNCSFQTVCGRCWSQKQQSMHTARMFCKAKTFQ